jgi:hypothetical protein
LPSIGISTDNGIKVEVHAVSSAGVLELVRGG